MKENKNIQQRFLLSVSRVIFLAASVLLYHPISAQGIRFEQDQTWQQVLAKAKAEHKYIFVDCYTTWCGPCKSMDRNIYSLKEVGDQYNPLFLSVKLQMDKTPADSPDIKRWYREAGDFDRNYAILVYPTYLFFDPEGRPVHKATGYQDAKNFIRLAADAQDPSKQYYSILKNYQPGKLDTSELKGLARSFYNQDKALAGELAADYLNRIPREQLSLPQNLEFAILFKTDPLIYKIAKAYIDRSEQDQFYTPPMIMFLDAFADQPEDRGFRIFYDHSDKVNTVMGNNDYAQFTIADVISRAEYLPLFNTAKVSGIEPDWKALTKNIAQKYNPYYAERVVLSSKAGWYKYMIDAKKQDQYWTRFIDVKIEQVTKFRYDTLDGSSYDLINKIAWLDLFQHATDKDQLKTGIDWMKQAVDKHPDNLEYIDTYACILYKAGQPKEAIGWEEKVLQYSIANKREDKIDYTTRVIEKMKKGIQFWLEKEYFE